MGRPPSNGGPAFRFNPTEVAEMEAILQAHNTAMPAHEVLVALSEKFSASAERSGKVVVQMKQVWNWFQNRRYAIRAKAAKASGRTGVLPMPSNDSAILKTVPQAFQPIPAPSATLRNVPQAPQPLPAPSGKNGSDNSQMEFEARSARDGAWYDVATFLSHRYLETGDPEVLVRFAGFGPEEDEWVNVRKHVRQRSLPCESSECVVVLPGDLILCFQEGKEQALYFDAHVLDAQRRRHDVRGCRCRFLVRYDHDQSEEIVPLRKVCRRPETDYRLQQLHAANDSATLDQQKVVANHNAGSTLRVHPPAEQAQKQQKAEEPSDAVSAVNLTSHANVPVSTENKVMQPRAAECANAGNMGNANVPLSNVAAATENKVQQQIADIVNAGTMGSADVPPSDVAATGNANADNMGNANAPPNYVTATGNVNIPPSIVAATGDAGSMGNANASRSNVAAPGYRNPAPDNVAAIGNVDAGNMGNANVLQSVAASTQRNTLADNVAAAGSVDAGNMGNANAPQE